ncbi:MAG: thermonuclease family protein [Pseudomonadota bacterium]
MLPCRMVAAQERVAALLAAPAFPIDEMVRGGTHKVERVADGDTVTLASGRDVRMVGMQAPKLPLGRPGYAAWPLAQAAKAELERLVAGQTVTLYFGGRDMDRYGRWLAHLVRSDGLWLQAAMLEAGLARVYTFSDNRSGIAALLAAEARARAARRGIWAHPFYQVRTPKALEAEPQAFVDTFQIVRGVVDSTGDAGGRIFINFGGDWSTDFTAVIGRGARRRYGNAFRIESLRGTPIELRGWVTLKNGPSIDITHPEQIVYYPTDHGPEE